MLHYEKIGWWLNGRANTDGVLTDVPRELIRTRPPVVRHIRIFGEPFEQYRLQLPGRITWADWLNAYDYAIKAFFEKKDPLVAVSEITGMGMGRLRTMLSGYLAHEVDEMAYIAETMALAAQFNFGLFAESSPSVWVHDANSPIMGVTDRLIINRLGDWPAVRTAYKGVHVTSENCRRRVKSRLWRKLYLSHWGDEDALHVLDTLLTTNTTPVDEIYRRLDLKPRTVAEMQIIYEKKNAATTAAIPAQTALDALMILQNSASPIIDLHKLLVPSVMSGAAFGKVIGNTHSQPGRVRATTAQRIKEWIESQPEPV